MTRDAARTGDWRVRMIDKDSDLSVDHLGMMGPYEVVDIKFARHSVFTRMNGFGIWPQIPLLCSFVCREGYPKPEQVKHWIRYNTSRGAIYRLFVIP